MHVDDRLATALAVSATGDNQARVQWRQLLDLIGTMPAEARGPSLDAGLLRIAELSRRIPAAERAAAVRGAGLRLRNPRLVAELGCDHPAVAEAAIAMARLTADQWLDLLPALPPPARAALRRRSDLAADVRARLGGLGAADPGLPAPPAARETPVTAVPPVATTRDKVVPLRSLAEPADPAPGQAAAPAAPAAATAARDGIGAIVRRIEAFRRHREAAGPAANDAPRLPLGEEGPMPRLKAFAFACDVAGRICWADAHLPGMVVGLLLPLADRAGSPDPASSNLAAAFRRHVPIRGATLTLAGAPAIAGDWVLDAAPEFDRAGRFTGYLGKLRRPARAAAVPHDNPEANRVRQVLHELRTPVNAVQGFAEMIHQQLVGPVPHAYRALAAGIAADAAQMLAGFDELDRLARLDSGALAIEPGTTDLAATLAGLIAQLDTFTGPRGSGFALARPGPGADSTRPWYAVAIEHDEVERLGWRLLATLAGHARPGEVLSVTLGRVDDRVSAAITLPEALASLSGPAEASGPVAPASISGGLFGPGFALRLAAAEARGAGGSLTCAESRAVLTLPAAHAGQLADPVELPNPDAWNATTFG